MREQAAAALTQLTEQVETRIEQLTQQVSQTQDALTAAADAQNSAASALRNAPYGSNTAALKNAYSSAASRLSNLQDTKCRIKIILQESFHTRSPFTNSNMISSTETWSTTTPLYFFCASFPLETSTSI